MLSLVPRLPMYFNIHRINQEDLVDHDIVIYKYLPTKATNAI